jgi:hypothetical protein
VAAETDVTSRVCSIANPIDINPKIQTAVLFMILFPFVIIANALALYSGICLLSIVIAKILAIIYGGQYS